MGSYDDEDVDARWYLEHGWPHDAADMLAQPGASLSATPEEFRLLQPLIEKHGLRALYLDGDILVLPPAEAAGLLREVELDRGRHGPVSAPPPATERNLRSSTRRR